MRRRSFRGRSGRVMRRSGRGRRRGGSVSRGRRRLVIGYRM